MKKNSFINITKETLKVVVISASGWAVFYGIISLLKLTDLSPFLLIGGGLVASWLIVKFGLKKK